MACLAIVSLLCTGKKQEHSSDQSSGFPNVNRTQSWPISWHTERRWAEPHYEHAGRLFKAIGNRRGYAWARFGVGLTRSMLADWPAALAACRQSLTLARRMRDTDLLTYIL